MVKAQGDCFGEQQGSGVTNFHPKKEREQSSSSNSGGISINTIIITIILLILQEDIVSENLSNPRKVIELNLSHS